jgi:hypothetical protein
MKDAYWSQEVHNSIDAILPLLQLAADAGHAEEYEQRIAAEKSAEQDGIEIEAEANEVLGL